MAVVNGPALATGGDQTRLAEDVLEGLLLGGRRRGGGEAGRRLQLRGRRPGAGAARLRRLLGHRAALLAPGRGLRRDLEPHRGTRGVDRGRMEPPRPRVGARHRHPVRRADAAPGGAVPAPGGRGSGRVGTGAGHRSPARRCGCGPSRPRSTGATTSRRPSGTRSPRSSPATSGRCGGSAGPCACRSAEARTRACAWRWPRRPVSTTSSSSGPTVRPTAPRSSAPRPSLAPRDSRTNGSRLRPCSPRTRPRRRRSSPSSPGGGGSASTCTGSRASSARGTG